MTGRVDFQVLSSKKIQLDFILEAKLGVFLDQGMGVKSENVVRFQAWASQVVKMKPRWGQVGFSSGQGFSRWSQVGGLLGSGNGGQIRERRSFSSLSSSWWLWKSRFWGFVIQKMLLDLILMAGRVDFQVLSSKKMQLDLILMALEGWVLKKAKPHWFSPHFIRRKPPGVSSSWWLLEE